MEAQWLGPRLLWSPSGQFHIQAFLVCSSFGGSAGEPYWMRLRHRPEIPLDGRITELGRDDDKDIPPRLSQ